MNRTFTFAGTIALLSLIAGLPLSANAQGTWNTYGGNAQHTAISTVASQSLGQIVWQTPVDLDPQYSGTSLLIHYGSPLVSANNTVIVPVKTGATQGFRIEAHDGATGSLLWQHDSDYIMPLHNWTPSYAPTLTPNGRIYQAGAGGTLYYRDNVDSATGTFQQVAFYGIDNYNANKAALDTSIRICTPLTSDAEGNIYFGYRTYTANSLGVTSGIARIGADGSASYVSALTASNGGGIQIAMNCAPALSNDGKTIYVAANAGSGFASGALVALDATTLATKNVVVLKDPKTGNNAVVTDDGTASPMVGADGNVYYGVLENPFQTAKGWMLQFNSDLTEQKTTGAFGWDDTASMIPASMVASYHGTSSYLLMTKYNNYAGLGGDGINKLAILDPNATQIDARTGATVMEEVLTIAGVTPDPEYLAAHPDAVREWCINTAAVDPFTNSVLVNSEDGKLYRWDLATNLFTEQITLTAGIGEAYTPTIIGQDGKVYAINNATLFAVGAVVVPEPGSLLLLMGGSGLLWLKARKKTARK